MGCQPGFGQLSRSRPAEQAVQRHSVVAEQARCCSETAAREAPAHRQAKPLAAEEAGPEAAVLAAAAAVVAVRYL